MDNQRHPFGGDASTVAEDNSGRRIPNTSGNVYLQKTDLQAETDLLNEDGSAASLVRTDDKGMVMPFFGPPGASTLWIDFGAGRYQVFATDVISAAAQHIAAGYDEDPHGTLTQARKEMQTYTDRNAPNTVPLISSEAWISVVGRSDTSGDVATVRNPGGTGYRWVLRQDGSMVITNNTEHIPFEIQAGDSPNSVAIAVTGPGGETSDPLFWVGSDGVVHAKKPIEVPNIGNARVFSGPEAPANPRVGDVWVKYG